MPISSPCVRSRDTSRAREHFVVAASAATISFTLATPRKARGLDCRARLRARLHDGRKSEFECRDGLLATHGRELLQKVADRITRGEVIEKVVDRNARADEYRFATHDLGIAVDDLRVRAHKKILLRRFFRTGSYTLPNNGHPSRLPRLLRPLGI